MGRREVEYPVLWAHAESPCQFRFLQPYHAGVSIRRLYAANPDLTLPGLGMGRRADDRLPQRDEVFLGPLQGALVTVLVIVNESDQRSLRVAKVFANGPGLEPAVVLDVPHQQRADIDRNPITREPVRREPVRRRSFAHVHGTGERA